MEVQQIVLYIQFASVILALIIASIQDIIKREVEDYPWLFLFIEGLVTSIIYLVYSEDLPHDSLLVGLNFLLALITGFFLYYSGIMGGADAKAIMVLGLNTASYPFSIPLTELLIYDYVPPIFNVFFNWLLIMVLAYPLPILVYNLWKRAKGERLFDEVEGKWWSKILMLISGYKLPVEKAKERVDVLYSEIYNQETKAWELKHFMQVEELEEEEKFKKEIEEQISQTGKKKIWVKIMPPGIVFLTLGYITTLLIGNPLFAILSLGA